MVPVSRMIMSAVVVCGVSVTEAKNLTYPEYITLISVHNEVNAVDSGKVKSKGMTAEQLAVHVMNNRN